MIRTNDYETYRVNLVVLKKTRDAIRVFNGSRKIWVPKSLIENLREVGPEDWAGEIELPQWFLEKEGLV